MPRPSSSAYPHPCLELYIGVIVTGCEHHLHLFLRRHDRVRTRAGVADGVRRNGSLAGFEHVHGNEAGLGGIRVCTVELNAVREFRVRQNVRKRPSRQVVSRNRYSWNCALYSSA